MFFPDRIKNISKNDKVLEIGPGGNPYYRSDVFLDKKFSDEKEFKHQRGNTPKLITNKPVFYYSGKEKFPFENNSFDYVICSHVIEHILDIPFFLEEMFRIANKGYIEFPKIQYEYLYNFYAHENFIARKEGGIIYLNKKKTNLYDFCPVQDFFYSTLTLGYTQIIDSLKELFFDGFEWEGRFRFIESNQISDFVGIYDELTHNSQKKQGCFQFREKITKIFKGNK